ncbi:MAG: prolyl-tRNA synthetase [Candidatus Moranbacteria bacterium]|nr:prolyl-tRNA synthetase [Candidatus Moranbacteria bacterium]OIQ03510.1 MAG: prolyl-tRNA synthetase [Candidatus Moranbacteria bacterium CG2_30_41_165]PIP25289.1 MAG: prolyl-tRNA synthetase [Candidatus Moranbacteria bacterium CG23_combo_of_CG06-09_8_20_14_all_41_28]PIV86573.1 MAG: prolyl-tRNA synthetase [Candidatus Moranbacteria bacterium CG17_big_fil_post_rev_8_21_14_2_50_41_107]PIW94174.1 MAG: prolyl-tRNA synthetase [Candidatus Moranbacteria bacterium CG_4_8_14_3_um_filter_41_13]PIX91935.1 M
MRQSALFVRTKKEAPKDEVSKNAQLLLRAGFIHKEMAGAYSFLPLGLRVLNNIIQIIREEMNKVGGQEVLLSSLQDKELWEKTDRWDDEKVDVWFKTKLKNGTNLGLAVTHEEPMTRMMTQHISSYRDLPALTYHFQTKFRNETRAKSGIMRMREFLMKDLYSFSRTEEEHDALYVSLKEAYKIVFKRVGLGEVTYPTFASGGMFSKYSEEFQTVSDAGEDSIYVDEANGQALNAEVLNDEVLADLGLKRENLVEKKSIEVGNIFSLGTRFSVPLGLTYKNEKGESLPVIMGSYGIGPARVMGTIAEVLSDDLGLVWPESVAPFQVHLLSLGADEKATEIYEMLTKAGIEVLYDDRDMRAGEKFAESDLLGIPYRVVVGKRSVESGKAEVKKRTEKESEEKAFEDLASFFKR